MQISDRIADGASSVVTCAKREGNLFHEASDAKTLASWGVDYWKYDACGEDNLQAYAKFTVMRDALNHTGRPIVYSFEPHGSSGYCPVIWPSLTGNSWRTGSDIRSGYGSVMGALAKANAWANVGGAGGWNDADSESSKPQATLTSLPSTPCSYPVCRVSLTSVILCSLGGRESWANRARGPEPLCSVSSLFVPIPSALCHRFSTRAAHTVLTSLCTGGV